MALTQNRTDRVEVLSDLPHLTDRRKLMVRFRGRILRVFTLPEVADDEQSLRARVEDEFELRCQDLPGERN
jgi:hypothetical protein